MDRVKERLSSDALVDFDQILVMQIDQKLNDDQYLVDFVFPEYIVTVHYPTDITGRPSWQLSIELDDYIFADMFEEFWCL